ncbi:MAG: SGNH/GDSL hydrolase family protein [Oscillospiraceae bacterium]|nr:SGNH/GDSL hydrolase family protein [Oscillospiraceae bacterium]
MSVFSIEIFGDSLMSGVLFDEERGRYAHRKGHKFDNLPVPVKNNSKMGATVLDGKRRMENRLDEITPDTLVIIEFGGNDCDYDWRVISEAPESEHKSHVEPELYAETLREMIALASSQGARVAVCNLPSMDCVRYFEWISRLGDRENILKWLGEATLLSRRQEYYCRIAESVARGCGVDIIDLRTPFFMRRDLGTLLCADGIHPSQKGYAIIDDAIEAYVNSLV